MPVSETKLSDLCGHAEDVERECFNVAKRAKVAAAKEVEAIKRLEKDAAAAKKSGKPTVAIDKERGFAAALEAVSKSAGSGLKAMEKIRSVLSKSTELEVAEIRKELSAPIKAVQLAYHEAANAVHKHAELKRPKKDQIIDSESAIRFCNLLIERTDEFKIAYGTLK